MRGIRLRESNSGPSVVVMQADSTSARTTFLAVDSERLDALRVAHGIPSDAELARRIGVHPGTLIRARDGKTIASNEFLAKIAAAFPHISKDDLFKVVTGG